MSFSAFVAAASVVLLLTGAAFGCLVCILCGCVFRRPYVHVRFSLFCILLSVACAAGTVLLIFQQPHFFLFLSSSVFLLCGGVVFCAGFFCAVFWRIILPLVVMLYIAVTVFTGVTLYSVFGVQNDTLAVSVQREGFSVNENFYAAEKPEGMYFNLYTLPSVLLLPLPRVWYVPSAEENGNAVQMARLEQKRFPQVVNRYISWCLSDLNCRYVSFADEERTLVYPALFTCLMERSWELVTIRLHQDL